MALCKHGIDLAYTAQPCPICQPGAKPVAQEPLPMATDEFAITPNPNGSGARIVYRDEFGGDFVTITASAEAVERLYFQLHRMRSRSTDD